MIHRSTNKTPAPLQHLLPKKDPATLPLADRAALFLDEAGVSLAQAAKLIPPTRQDKPVHVSTLIRWILHGVRGVKLEAARIGGRWVTSREALGRFSAELTAKQGAPDTDLEAARPASAAYQRRQDQVARGLEKFGF